MHKMYLAIGDHDGINGHGRGYKKLYECNYDADVIRTAYKASCKLTGVNLSDVDYTGKNYDVGTFRKYEVGNDCDEFDNLNNEVVDIFKRHGIPEELLYFDGERYTFLNFECLWWWFVSLSLPDLNFGEVNDNIPVINRHDELNCEFGYGVV